MTGMETDGSWVLVEGPAWGDAQFYGEWPLAAAKAQVLWRTALEDQEFATQVERVRSSPIERACRHGTGLPRTVVFLTTIPKPARRAMRRGDRLVFLPFDARRF